MTKKTKLDTKTAFIEKVAELGMTHGDLGSKDLEANEANKKLRELSIAFYDLWQEAEEICVVKKPKKGLSNGPKI